MHPREDLNTIPVEEVIQVFSKVKAVVVGLWYLMM